jgi:hypothetical protein
MTSWAYVFCVYESRDNGLEQLAQVAELAAEAARVDTELRQQRSVVLIVGVDLVRKLLRRLLSRSW